MNGELETTTPFMIVGLGNPGKQYVYTRHNLGFLVIEAFANQLGWSFREERKFQALAAKGEIKTLRGVGQVHLLLPLTYMNLSGIAVQQYLYYYKLPISSLLVVTDDIAIPYGKMRLRTGGSSGGHKGLKSIENTIGTDQYARLRMGIGSTIQSQWKIPLEDYVLSCFSNDEMEKLGSFVERGAEILKKMVLSSSIEGVMKDANTG